MDLLSYKLGKNAGGGGGSGADLSKYFDMSINEAPTQSDNLSMSFVKRIPPLVLPNNISLQYLFYTYPHTYASFENVDCSGVTALPRFMTSSNKLKYLDLSNFHNTDSITDIQYGFASNTALEKVTNFFALPNSSRLNLTYLFYDCANLKSVDLSKLSFQTAYLEAMFRNCKKLAVIDISSFDLNSTSAVNYSYMFSNCGINCLQSDGAYADGITKVYVKDQASQSWILGLSSYIRPSTWTTDNVIIKQ